MEIEIWKDVLGYEGLYEVSNLGNLKSLRGRWEETKIINGTVSYWGYRVAGLYKNKKIKINRVNRLVLLAFVGNPESGMVSRHLNGNKLDNRLENLQWGTIQANKDDEITHGTRVNGERQGLSKLNKEKVKLARLMHSHFGWSLTKIHTFFISWGVSLHTICMVLNHKTWKHV